MDLTADRNSAEPSPDTPEPDAPDAAEDEEVSFTEEQAALCTDADNRIEGAIRRLALLSEPGRQYGLPENLETTSLINALAEIVVNAGLCTMPELIVKKQLHMADTAEQAAENAAAHANQVRKAMQAQRAEAAGITLPPGISLPPGA